VLKVHIFAGLQDEVPDPNEFELQKLKRYIAYCKALVCFFFAISHLHCAFFIVGICAETNSFSYPIPCCAVALLLLSILLVIHHVITTIVVVCCCCCCFGCCFSFFVVCCCCLFFF